LPRQVDVVRLAAFHALLWDGPDRVLEIDFVPDRIEQLALAYHGEQDQTEAQTDGRQGRYVLQLMEHDANLHRREGAVLGRKSGDGGRTDLISRVSDLLAVQNCKAVDLLDDIAHVNGSRRRASVLHLDAERAQIIGSDFSHQAIFPDRKNV